MRLEPLYRCEIVLGPVHELGEGPHGRRRIIPILGGRFKGEKLQGSVVPGGADWQVIRRDGVAELDARYTLETSDGALLYVRHEAYRHGPPQVMQELAQGREVDPSSYYMRGALRLETAEPRYDWLNRTLFVTTGARRAASVELEVFEVK
ncbi:MAG: DUF3237 domain-containing protein [Betaproteobacteria bacterium]|nr:DUF3237 domain-containing protein [Betaproteobacteria bacterium]